MRKALNLILLIVALGTVMLVLREYEFGNTNSVFQPKSLAATGFILLAAFSIGEFFKLLNIPALLGYIAAGIVFGPNFFAALNAWGGIESIPEVLFSKSVISDLTLINVLTVGVIGTMGGGELILEDIKQNLKAIVLVVALIFAIALPATAVAVLWVARDLPQYLPFLTGLSIEHHYAAALLFGVFAVAMSPAATLAILQETRAHGRFTSLALGVVIVADLVLVAAFLLAFAFDKILLAPEGFTVALLVAELPKIGAEFGYAILLGVATGAVFIAFLRFVRQRSLFFTIAIIFITSAISVKLHAETLLAFLTAGFMVQNFSKHGHDMIRALEKISLPVFMIYFMTQAAQLDLQAVAGFAVITAILTVVRAGALYLGATLGTHWAKSESPTNRYLWVAFFSRGGVDLVLAAKVASSSLPWGVEFQTVIMACVVVHIMIGPPLLKLALDWSGETEDARRQTAEEAEAFEQLPAVNVSTVGESFPTARFEDPELSARVTELRALLVDLHRDHISDPLDAKIAALDESFTEASVELQEAFERLDAVLASDEYETALQRAEAVTQVHVHYLMDIADNVQTWEEINPKIVHYDRIQEIIEAVRNREDFAKVYRVGTEAQLFEPGPGDRVALRAAKSLRRVRSSLFGAGTRQVPLGRLWRYYVELMLPRYLASAADATSVLNERFWADLGNHLRRLDDLFGDVYDAVIDGAAVEVADEADEADEDAEPASPVAAALAVFAAGREAAIEREAQLVTDLQTLQTTSLDRYTVSLREPFANFVSAAEVAGTIQLPQWRYRPSTLFDGTRRAEAKIADRLRREDTVVTGHRGWIVAEWQLVLFLYWLSDYERSIRQTLTSLVGNPVSSQVDVLAMLCDALPDEFEHTPWANVSALRTAVEAPGAAEQTWPDVDWERWLDGHARPVLHRARTNFQRMVGLYDKGFVTRRLLEPLERRVGEFSEQIVLLSEHPDHLATNRDVPTLTIRLREWFESEVVRETALRLVEFDERGEAILRTCSASLEEIQQVIEFNLLTAHRDAANANTFPALDVATGGLERAHRMLDELRDAQSRRLDQLANWIVEESSQIAERAAEPFLQHRHAEIERIMARRGQATLAARGENWAMTAVNGLVSVVRGTYRRWSPIAEEVVEDLRGLFVEDVEPIHHADIRHRLRPEERIAVTIPAIYRRLFTPVPLDIPDFYVPRLEVEQQVVHAVSDWVQGRGSTILIHGDRGMGKRSTVQHLLQHSPDLAGLRHEYEIHNVVLDDDLNTEAELVHQLGTALPNEPAVTMEGLVRFIELVDSRHIIVVENGEKLFSRTRLGLDTMKRFLSAMNETSSNVLWIVLAGTSAVTYLETAIGVLDYFTHSFEIGPLDDEGVTQMIQKRHRVSGFRANFDRERPRIRDWIRRPIGTSDALRDPQAEFFRDLSHLSGGNPMRALMYWLDACRLDETDDHLIWLSSLPDDEPELVSQLSLTKRLILAALVQHHTLTPLQLRSILRRELTDVQTELDHLQRLGFVRPMVGRQVTAYRLRDLAESLVTVSLRDMNMI